MRIFSLLFVLILSGCMGPAPFAIKQADNRFSESKIAVYTSQNNRISSKSIAGGTHINARGVFINPYISKKPNGKIDSLGFNITNLTDTSSLYGSPNQLGIIQEISFKLSNGHLVKAQASGQKSQHYGGVYYNSVTRGASMEKSESAIVEISKKDFIELANAKSIACKITGSKRSVTYNQSDIADTFLANIKSFQMKHVN